MGRTSIHIVAEHLEGISGQIFDEFRQSIALLVEKRNGIYALYSDGKLYYVGLAKNLRSRLKRHMQDKHDGLWDRFSVYLTKDDSHLRELEALLLRVLKPVGNSQRGKLKGSTDLKRTLERDVAERQKLERMGLLGSHTTRTPRNRVGRAKASSNRAKPEAARIDGRTVFLKRVYKGREYKATLRRDGTVRHKGKAFTSLSAAAVAITGRSTNGWTFWKARNSEKKWVRLKHLRS